MDEFDRDAIQDWLLRELTWLGHYRAWIEETQEGGTQRMLLYQADIMKEHIGDQLRRLQR